MKRVIYLMSLFMVVCSCMNNSNGNQFSYNPTIPYPLFNPGDFWLDKFDQRGLQNARVYDDHLYCNTIEVGGDNYLYSFDLKTGTANWRALVGAYATQSATEINDTIFYCSYLGEMQAFDKFGKEIWSKRYDHPYAGHWVDTNDSKIRLKTVMGNEISIFKLNGELLPVIESPILKKKIDKYGKYVDQISKRYQLKHGGWNYSIEVSTPQNRKEHQIKIKKYI